MKVTGTVEAIREIEQTVELARTKGKILIGKEVKKKQPIQGEKWESKAFSRSYEIYADEKVKDWEDSSHAFFKLLVSDAVPINFWYEYRDGDSRKGMGNVSIAKRHLEAAYKIIPGFKVAFKRAVGQNNGNGDNHVDQKNGSQSQGQGEKSQGKERKERA